MKRIQKSNVATNETKSATSDEKVAQNSIASRLRELQGSQSTSAFARKCGVGESLMRQYLAGSEPGARKLAQIADANEVTVEWLATGRLPKQRRSQETGPRDAAVEGVIDAYIAEEMLTTIIEAIEEVAQPLSAKEKARQIAVATRLYKALSPEERARSFSKIVLALFDVRQPIEEPQHQADQEWPLVDRRHVARRKTDAK